MVHRPIPYLTGMDSRHAYYLVVVFLRSGAGSSPWRFKMFPTVWTLIP